MKNIKKKLRLISIILTICLIVTSVSWPTDVKAADEYCLYNQEGLSITYKVNNSWNDSFNATIQIVNDTEKTIENWRIALDYNNIIENIWNATIEQNGDSHYVIVNNKWNQDIAAKSKIDFGFTAKSNCNIIPVVTDFISRKDIIGKEKYETEFIVNSEWNEGFSGEITIKNCSDCLIEDFILEFDFDGDISELWNGKILSNINNHYVIGNAEYNQNIEAGQKAVIGLIGKKSSKESAPCNYSLYSYGNNVSGNKDSLEVKETNDSNEANGSNTASQNEANSSSNTAGQNEADSTNNIVSQKEDNITNTATIQNETESTNSATDTNDANNTNVNENEAEDGVEYVELSDGKINKEYLSVIQRYLVLDGLSCDDVHLSDDYDGDGLTLAKEYEYDTNPFKEDSDEDGLLDYDEIHVYGTCPINHDSDGDGLSDGTEISCGLNALVKDSDGNGINDDEETITVPVRLINSEKYDLTKNGVIPSITITGKGEYNNQIFLEAVTNNTAITSLDYIVGTAYDFVHEDFEFDESTITFEISDEILDNYSIEDLCIISYDTENGTVSFLETYVDKSTSKVYAVTDHYSVYMVASTYDFLRVSDISRKKSLEESGENGSETKQYGQIINRGYYFIEPNKQVVKHPFWIVERQDEFFIIEDNTDSIPLLLIGNLDRIIDLLPTITRYTRKTYREKLYNDESVPYLPHYAYWADMRGGVEGIAVESSNFSDNEQYYARLSDGNIVLLDKDPNFGDKTVDSDSDGICDIDELGVKTKIPVYDPASNKNLLLEAWTFKSNPVSKDTDGDGILDTYDVEPLIYNYVVVEEDDDHITFNTGNVWYKVKMIPIQYRKAFYVESNFDLAELAGEVPNYRDEIQKIAENEKTDFSTTELSIAYIFDLDIKYINGSRLYMNDNFSEAEQVAVYKNIFSEPITYYRHNKFNNSKDWEKDWEKLDVKTRPESGFFKGVVWSSADINCTCVVDYGVNDIYAMTTVLGKLAVQGVLIASSWFLAKGTALIVSRNLLALKSYIATYGVAGGVKVFAKIGADGLPNGIFSWLELDLSDGDTAVDDMIDAAVKDASDGDLAYDDALYYYNPSEVDLSKTTPAGEIIYQDASDGDTYLDDAVRFIAADLADGDSALDDVFAGATKGGSKLPLKMNLQFFAKKGGKNSTGYKYWKESIDFQGNKVYQRNDLFDPAQVSSWKDNGKTVTGTNVERMASGRAPIGYDGKSVNLHHLSQTPDGPIVEVSQSFHNKYYSTIHMNTGQSPSIIDRDVFKQWKSDYWKNRALDFD